MTIQFRTISTNGIQLNTALAGPEEGEPVILLHGFPEAWFGWENQIEPLVKAGYRVIVPDQRGYNLSEKPIGIDNYQMNILVDDILGLANSLGYQQFHLAGHDFGAMVSWSLALRVPERVKRLAIANVPHPAVFKSYLKTHPAQMLKSWYAFFFQLPRLPELMVKANNWRFLTSAMPDYFSNREKDRYREAWEQPGAITGMINWYRSTYGRSKSTRPTNQVQPPTLIIWGKRDPHLSHEMADLSLEFCQDGKLVYFEDATHWVQHDKAAEVSQLLVEHFTTGVKDAD
ncbi:MAG: alpha/beta hydrolase [Anaerolineales bacterium]|nr:MAG: alpha/beta hydrolase [Anaerolineales bacterium]